MLGSLIRGSIAQNPDRPFFEPRFVAAFSAVNQIVRCFPPGDKKSSGCNALAYDGSHPPHVPLGHASDVSSNKAIVWSGATSRWVGVHRANRTQKDAALRRSTLRLCFWFKLVQKFDRAPCRAENRAVLLIRLARQPRHETESAIHRLPSAHGRSFNTSSGALIAANLAYPGTPPAIIAEC